MSAVANLALNQGVSVESTAVVGGGTQVREGIVSGGTQPNFQKVLDSLAPPVAPSGPAHIEGPGLAQFRELLEYQSALYEFGLKVQLTVKAADSVVTSLRKLQQNP